MLAINQATRMNHLMSAIFTQMDDLRKAEISRGKDVVTLSIGSPDMPPAQHIMEALAHAVSESANYGYTLSKGTEKLLNSIAEWYKRKFSISLDPETEIHSLMGSQDGLSHIAMCLVDPGDVVLVPDPGYPIYTAGPLIAGADLYRMPLIPANGYLPDLDTISKDVLRRTKMMIINYPNNPLAATATQNFFSKVVDIANRYSFVVVHDFAYSELVYDGYRPDSFLSVPGAKEVGIELHSLSKTYNMAGCRIGFAVGNRRIIELLGRLKSNIDYGVFYPIQQAAVAALNGSQQCVKDLVACYQRRRDVLIHGFNKLGWTTPSPKASMFVWAPVPTRQSSLDFTVDLLKNTGIAVIPGIAFGEYGEGFVRIALVQPEERLRECVERLSGWLG
ncbi:LL-diaminopimelate aminotransferase [Propionispora sp. 2/2-37]|uniref:aminotransferase class I/II-fold pyridoxal phosphate-dependent enzyme n=1 Tax=Propionispora sp. 2/2-37 TaxID=1677858 RepID=UPI0006C6C2AE|nr:aminotransferase class I/II-fold pyridoxal phosphate-dependent enzyme [Propionispora sp. 2/2-37]CUH94253.1 LL-diaminopimelate aminotransferase [Propionispora sp. 2/2-37]